MHCKNNHKFKTEIEMNRLCMLPLLLILILGGCNPARQSGTAKGSKAKPVITVSIEPLRYFTEALAGDRFTVACMVPKGTSPETYDPTPAQLIALSQSEAFFRIGYIGFELAWADRLSDTAPHLQFFDMSRGIDLIYEGFRHGKNMGRNDGHYHNDGVEPHIWNSCINAQIIAGNIVKALRHIDQEYDSIYLQRYDSLCRRIEYTDSLCCAMLSGADADDAFMIYHPALSYFARDYGLLQIPIEAGGKEPTPAHLQEIIRLCKEEEVHVIFVQPEFDRRNAELLARQTDCKVVDINPLAYEWEQEMLKTAGALCGKDDYISITIP